MLENFQLGIQTFFHWSNTFAVFTGITTGIFIGAIPGIGSVISSFISYGMAKRGSKNPEEFGTGSLEGIAAAEAGNNSVCGAT